MTAVREKLDEYLAWGVPHVWLVDPHARRLYTCDPAFREVENLSIPALQIEIKKGDVFDWQ